MRIFVAVMVLMFGLNGQATAGEVEDLKSQIEQLKEKLALKTEIQALQKQLKALSKQPAISLSSEADNLHRFDGRWEADFLTNCYVIAPVFVVQGNKFTWSITGDGYTIQYENTINSDGSFVWSSKGYISTFMQGKMDPDTGTGESSFNGGGECNGKITYTKLN